MRGVWVERAVIALSVGLSWPPDRHGISLGRTSTQRWERALEERIFHQHEIPHGVCLQRPDCWRPGERYHRPTAHARRDRLRWHSLCTPLHSLGSSPATRQNAAKSTSTASCATGSSTCPTSGRQSGDGTCNIAWLRSGACALGCSTGSTRTSRSTAWQENFAIIRRHDTAERVHHAGVRRPVPQRGHDQEPGARMTRRRGTSRAGATWVKQLLRGMRVSYKSPTKSTRPLAASGRCIRSGRAAAASNKLSCRATRRTPEHSRSPAAWTVARWT